MRWVVLGRRVDDVGVTHLDHQVIKTPRRRLELRDRVAGERRQQQLGGVVVGTAGTEEIGGSPPTRGEFERRRKSADEPEPQEKRSCRRDLGDVLVVTARGARRRRSGRCARSATLAQLVLDHVRVGRPTPLPYGEVRRPVRDGAGDDRAARRPKSRSERSSSRRTSRSARPSSHRHFSITMALSGQLPSAR